MQLEAVESSRRR